MGRGRKTLKISSSQDFQRVQKIRVFLVGQVRGAFSFFTVTECIALLIEACQYKINTSCSSLIIVLLPDFCIAKTKDDSPSSSEVSPVIDSTNSRSRTSKFPQEGKLTLYCFYFWLTVIWSRQHQGTHHLMCAKYSSLQPEKSGNEATTPELYQNNSNSCLLATVLLLNDICLARPCKSHLVFRAELIFHGEKNCYIIPSKLIYFFQ